MSRMFYRHRDGSIRDYPEFGLRDEHSPAYTTSIPISNQTDLIDEILPKGIEFELKTQEITEKKAIKNDQGKPPLSILTKESLYAEARGFEYGHKKYGDKHNYKLGMEWTRMLDASMRHIVAFSNKEDIDSESGLNHLWHAKCCLAMLIYYYENKKGLDDR